MLWALEALYEGLQGSLAVWMELEAPAEVICHLKASILSSREKIGVNSPVVSVARFVPLFSV